MEELCSNLKAPGIFYCILISLMLTVHLSGPLPVNPIDLSLTGGALFTQKSYILPPFINPHSFRESNPSGSINFHAKVQTRLHKPTSMKALLSHKNVKTKPLAV